MNDNNIFKELKEVLQENKYSQKDITEIELTEILSLGRTCVRSYIKELKQSGRISENAVKSTKQRLIKEAEERNIEIRQYAKEHPEMSYTEIAKTFFVSNATVCNAINGKKYIARKSKPKVFVKNENAELSMLEKNIVKMLESGYSYTYISKSLEIEKPELMKKVEWLKRRNVISQSELIKIKNEKNDKDEKRILELLKKGYKQGDILKEMPEHSRTYISILANRFIKQGIITREELNKAQENDMRKVQLEKLVFSCLKKGLTVKEIITLDETGYATEHRVRQIKKELIETGKIDLQFFETKHDIHEKNVKDKEYDEVDKVIYKFVVDGYSAGQISKYIKCNRGFIYRRMKFITKKYNLTKEQVQEYRKKRILKFNKIKQASKKENLSDSNFYAKRAMLFKLVNKNKKLGIEVDDETLDILAESIVLNENLLTKENLKLVIMEYIRKDRATDVKVFVKKMNLLYNDTEFGDAIKEYSDFLNKTLDARKDKKIDIESR